MSNFIPRKVKRGIIYKRCSKCKRYKPTTDFYPDRNRTPDYLQNYCKQCTKDYQNNYRNKK